MILNQLRYSNKFSIKKILFDSSADPVSRYIRHLIAGGFGTLLYTGFVAFFVEIIHYHPVTAAVISTLLNAVYTYFVHRKWVYNSNSRHLRAIPRFIMVGLVAILLNTIIMYCVVEIFHWWYGFGIIFAAAIVPPTNFLLNYYWTYR